MKKYVPLNVTANIVFEDRYKRKNTDFYEIKIRLWCNNRDRRFKTGIFLKKEEFNKLYSPNLKNERLKIIKKDIDAKLTKANKILADISDDFTFDLFGKLFYDEVEFYMQHGAKDDECETSEDISFFDLFDRYIKELEDENRIGSAKVYKATRNSLYLFQKNLSFKDIDGKFLKKFERFHLDRGNSLTTVGIHARHIRTIINLAIDLGIMNEKDYPFGKQRGKKNKYSIPTARNPKKALDEHVINKIIEYIPRHDDEWLARDLWLFSFFCNGMNPADIFDLRWNQISKDNIIYTRNKTKRSKKDIEPIIISINPIVRQIIFHWGRNRSNPKNYVFDIYKKGLSAVEKYVIKNNKLRSINQYMNRIAKRLKVDINLKISTARHSWGTSLMRLGVPMEYISKGYGPSSFNVTALYLGSFTQEQIENYLNLLHNKVVNKKKDIHILPEKGVV